MVPKTFEDAFSQVKGLAERCAANESAYLSPKYQEAEIRQDFLDKFWVALGWDVHHEEHPNPYEREVRIEKSVMVGDRGKKADYAFFTSPNFLQARFMAEAKKPARQLENQYDCFQAMRYGWNSNTPLAVLTDFEQFLILDSRYKPSVEKALNGILENFHYSQFSDEESFRRIYYLFSREAVGAGSLEKFIQGLKKAKTAKAAAVAPAVQIQPVGDTFLGELDIHREELARAFKRKNPGLDGESLTEITQRTLDRLVFIRFLEDKLVEPSEIIDRLGQKSGSAWRDFANEIPRLNSVYNGIIFKPHAILDGAGFAPDEKAFTDTLAWLSHKNSAYDFNTIPIHILGSIYERFLGKTIVVTDKRARVEEKPEVRKAGGVYYTPEYIVSYIVENTIGKLLKGSPPYEGGVDAALGGRGGSHAAETQEVVDTQAKNHPVGETPTPLLRKEGSQKLNPADIAKMRFADIACGSGSFLLGVFDYLIKYHVDWYSENKTRRADAIKRGLCRETAEGNLQLTIPHKRDILLNNIYGVDLDAQAVEVAQLSLYLKLLEEETTATAQQYLAGFREQLLPNLNKNIVHGNSLIDFDIMDAPLFSGSGVGSPHVSKGSSAPNRALTYVRATDTEHATDTLRKLNPMSFKDTFPEVFVNGGFDAIVGNPPYGKILSELSEGYLKTKMPIFGSTKDAYVAFIVKAEHLVKRDGKISFIVPSSWLGGVAYETLREQLCRSVVEQIVSLPFDVFKDAYVDTLIFVLSRSTPNEETIAQCFAYAKKEKIRAVEIEDWTHIPQSLWNQIDDNKFVLSIGTLLLLKKLKAQIKSTVTDAVDMRRGVLFDKGLLTENPTNEHSFRYFEGDVYRYNVNLVIDNFVEYGEKMTEYPKEFRWFEGSRILLRRLVNRQQRLMAGFATETFITNKNLYSLLLKDQIKDDGPKLLYVLGVLNSRLLSRLYIDQVSQATKDDFPQVTIKDVLNLPLMVNFDDPKEKAAHDRIVELVEKMIEAKKDLAEARTDSDRQFYERLCTSLDTQIDELVYGLYDITPDERKIIERA